MYLFWSKNHLNEQINWILRNTLSSNKKENHLILKLLEHLSY